MLANAFTTGGTTTDRYTLNSVVLDVLANVGNAVQLVVSIHNPGTGTNASNPGTQIGNNLTGTIDNTAGQKTLTASGITLNGNTTYFVQVKTSSTAESRDVNFTNSNAETGTGGWSAATIANAARRKPNSASPWGSWTGSIKFTVNATTQSTTPTPPTLTRSVLTNVVYTYAQRNKPSGSNAWNESFGLARGRLTGVLTPGVVSCTTGTAEIGWYKSTALTTRVGSYVSTGSGVYQLRYTPTSAGEYRALAYCKSGTTYSTPVNLMRGGGVTLTAGPALTANPIRATSARLTITNHTSAWWYKRTAPIAGTCTSVAAGTTHADLSSLTAGTSYTYKAYSATGCNTANEIASVTFQTASVSTPVNLRAEPGNGQMTLRWTTVTGARGYQYRALEGSRIVRQDWFPGSYGGDTSGVVTGLTNGTAYQFQVRAMRRGPATRYIEWVPGPWSNAISAAPVGPPPAVCSGRLTGDGSVTGRWTGDYGFGTRGWAPDCASAKRAGHATRYWRFTLAGRSTVTIDLRSGDADPWLYLWSGVDRMDGTPLAWNDDAGGSRNSRIVRTLAAGTYTVETTTYRRLDEGRFTLTVSGLGRTAPAPAQPTGFGAEAGDRQVTLRWDAMDGVTGWQVERDGVWTDAGDGLATGHTVTGLANGRTYRFRVRAVNDAGRGRPSAPVSVTLDAASGPGQAPSESRCTQRLAGDGSVTGRWAAGCDSIDRRGRHARWYELTLAERREMTIYLGSRTDAFLYLRSGAQQRSGRALEYDDDGGRGYDSRIRRTLDAGTYTIEATTFDPGTGDFTLTVFGGGGAATQQPEEETETTTPSPPAAEPALRVSDAQADEGHPYASGEMHFTVTLSPPAAHPVSVSYTTRDGTARGDLYGLYGDYETEYGRMSFAPGETRKTVTVDLIGDWHDEGPETFYLVLSDARGATIADGEGVGTIVNDDPIPAAWTARFGRTVADQVVGAVGERLRGASAPGVRLGGHRLSAEGKGFPAGGPDALPGAGDSFLSGAGKYVRALNARTGEDEEQHWREFDMGALLLASSFHLASAGDVKAGPRWSVWGRGAHSGFDGAEDALTLEGEVTTATLGADFERGRWLVGAALSRSSGEGSYATQGACDAGCSGEVESALTGFYPYARYRVSDVFTLWGVVGHGQGDLTLKPADGVSHETGLDASMAAAGARGVLLPAREPGGFELALRADLLVTRTRSDAAPDLAAAEAETSRVRLLLEGSRSVRLAGGAVLTPSVELGLRHEGGDAETGGGLELGGSLRYASGGLSVEMSARGLLAHSESDYGEWGVSGSVRYAPGKDGRGLSLSAGSSWGAAAGGAEHLWSGALRSFPPGGGFEPGTGFEAEAAWGLDAWRGLLTPYTGVALTGSGETWRTGARWKSGADTEVSLEASLTEPGGGAGTGGGVYLSGSKRW